MTGDADSPGVFRVPMTNEAALARMRVAIITVQEAAISARYGLLEAGFTDAHGLCRELDRIATRTADMLAVVHRQAAHEGTPV